VQTHTSTCQYYSRETFVEAIMGLLLFFGLLIAIVWSLVVFKHIPSIDGQIYLFPILGYLVILTGAVFSSEFFSVGGPIPITIDRLILGGMVALFCLMILARKETIFVFNRVDISVLILTAVIFLSTIRSLFVYHRDFRNARIGRSCLSSIHYGPGLRRISRTWAWSIPKSCFQRNLPSGRFGQPLDVVAQCFLPTPRDHFVPCGFDVHWHLLHLHP
jgi:hypothetical protein